MGAEYTVILEQMAVFLLLIGAGAAGIRLKALNADSLSALSSFAMQFAIPALIFSTLAGSATPGEIAASWPMVIVSVCISGLMFLTGNISALLCGLSGNRKRIHICQSTFGNMGMIAVPLISALYDGQGALPMAMFLLCDQVLLWTIGIRLGYPKESASGRTWKKLMNPVLIAAVLGIAYALFGFPWSGTIAEAVAGLGGTTKYVALIFVGGSLALPGAARGVREKGPYSIVLFKMLLCPMIVYCALRLIGIFDSVVCSVFALIAGMPSMGTLAVVARASGSDDAYASSVTFVTTLLAVLTLPLLTFVFGLLPL